MRRQAFSWLGLAALAALALGCNDADNTLTTENAMAQVRVDTAMLTSYDITRVTIEVPGLSQDLTLDAATGMFTGVLVLPVGTYDLVARAYQNATQVGASNPTSVTLQAGVVTQVVLRILDTTGGTQPDHGPILASLTYVTSTQAGTSVSFAVSAVDPDNDPVTIAWADDCADSTFSAPQAATTDWSKATQGSCNVTVTATANSLSASGSFTIVVFPAGANSGAVDLDGVFVSAPEINLNLYYGNQGCSVYAQGANASCSRPITSPEYADFNVYVNPANSGPGTLTVSDTCGGSVGIDYQDPYMIMGRWLPPVTGGVCFLSVHATNADGVAANLSAALLVTNGTPRVVSPPSINMEVQHGMGFCTASSSGGPVTCNPMSAGDTAYVRITPQWLDGYPGTVVITDNCGGTNNIIRYYSTHYEGTWSVPVQPGATCTLSVQATNLEGYSSQTAAVFQLF